MPNFDRRGRARGFGWGRGRGFGSGLGRMSMQPMTTKEEKTFLQNQLDELEKD